MLRPDFPPPPSGALLRAVNAAAGFRELRAPAAALEELAALDEADRDHPAVLAERVRISLDQGKTAEAAAMAKELLGRLPWANLVHELAAEALERDGRLEEALMALQDVPDPCIKDAGYLFREGVLLVRLGRIEEGKNQLAHAMELDDTVRAQVLDCPHLEAIW